MTWARWYWPVFLTVALIAFLIPEITALMRMNSQPSIDNTLSNWVWTQLKITKGEKIQNWSALDYLIFGQWIIMVSWLSWHFFLRDFT